MNQFLLVDFNQIAAVAGSALDPNPDADPDLVRVAVKVNNSIHLLRPLGRWRLGDSVCLALDAPARERAQAGAIVSFRYGNRGCCGGRFQGGLRNGHFSREGEQLRVACGIDLLQATPKNITAKCNHHESSYRCGGCLHQMGNCCCGELPSKSLASTTA
jgi:hypothetical protein